MIFSALVVMLLRIVSAQNGSFHAVSIGSGLAMITLFYVVGEVIRSRFRITMRALLVAIFGICLFSAIWGRSIIRTTRQRVAVDRLAAIGGQPLEGLNQSGNWVITTGGWVLPRPVANWLGIATINRIQNAIIDGERLSAEDIREIDPAIFVSVILRSCKFEEGAASALESLQGVLMLQIMNCTLADPELEGLSRIHTLDTLSIGGNYPDVTDAGIAHLKSLKSARSLYLVGFTNLTQRAIDDLQQELPDCELHWRAKW